MSGFSSNLKAMPVIDDSNWQDIIAQMEESDSLCRGRIPRDYEQTPYCSMPYFSAFPLPLIPRSEWANRIEERERTKSRLVDLCDRIGLGVENQELTNYCWINNVIHVLRIIRAIQGQKDVKLSPASCGAIITKYANRRGRPAGVGNWSSNGMQFVVETGACPVDLWPANAIDPDYDTPESRAARANFRVSEWWDLKPRNFDEFASCLLSGFPVAIGLNWWGHAVTAMDLVKLSGREQYGVIIDNSWGPTWGDRGRSVLSGSKMIPDDAVAPRAAVAA